MLAFIKALTEGDWTINIKDRLSRYDEVLQDMFDGVLDRTGNEEAALEAAVDEAVDLLQAHSPGQREEIRKHLQDCYGENHHGLAHGEGPEDDDWDDDMEEWED